MQKKAVCILFLTLLCAFGAGAQQKYAVVVGNTNYKYWNRLPNPVNDAADMKAALESLGFTVDYIADGDLDKMQTAVINLKKRLSTSHNSYGFFYFAGHGVETNGQNYLIPSDANIRSRNMLPQLALPVQFVLAELEDAKNEFNVIVLDACRNLPVQWDRGGNRGLFTETHLPSGSLVVHATEPGKTADDGDGRNSPFTAQLLRHIRTPGIEVNELFRRTGASVMQATKNAQIPTLYSKFHGIAYLGTRPNSRNQEPVPPPANPLTGRWRSTITSNNETLICTLNFKSDGRIEVERYDTNRVTRHLGGVWFANNIKKGWGNGTYSYRESGNTVTMYISLTISGVSNEFTAVSTNGNFNMNNSHQFTVNSMQCEYYVTQKRIMDSYTRFNKM